MGELYLDQMERSFPENEKLVFKTLPKLMPDTRYITSDAIHPSLREQPDIMPDYLSGKHLTYCQ